MSKKQTLIDNGYGALIVLEDFDEAIVGTTAEGNVVYEFSEMVACLMKDEEMTYDEAVEFIDYNTRRELQQMGDGAPIIMHRLEE